MSNCLLVQLPASWKQKLVIEPIDAESIIEQRSADRVKVLKEGTLCVTHTPEPLRPIAIEDSSRRSAGVLIKDMSSIGVGFLYHVQLFPKEIVEINLQGHLVTAIIRRSRYISAKCYEHGALIQCVKRVNTSQ